MNPNEHWLGSELSHLRERAGHPDRLGGGPIEWSTREERDAFLVSLGEFAEQVAKRRGVRACVVGHEGLVIAAAGWTEDAERLAAVAQQCLLAGVDASCDAGLGDFEQTLVVGRELKVVMFHVGAMTIAIQAHTGVDLAASLGERGSPSPSTSGSAP